MSLPDFDPAIHKEISNVPVVRWILGAQPENDLHGRCAASCQRRDSENALLRLKYDEERALNDNKERIFINHSGHWVAQIKKRATRKLWHIVDNCSLRRARLGRRPMKN
ncbi:MAG: hypothetical protein J6L86_02280, partial [Alphaproteobacteria bacterium]|nr:hypothetical protein [Alphaproteobacteria bacterium]